MRFLCKLGRHVWVMIKGTDDGYTWQEECKHCGEDCEPIRLGRLVIAMAMRSTVLHVKPIGELRSDDALRLYAANFNNGEPLGVYLVIDGKRWEVVIDDETSVPSLIYHAPG